MPRNLRASEGIALKRGVLRGAPKRSDTAGIKLSLGLCFRCEHRVRHLEEKSHQPRCECGMTECAVRSCYMYQPVKPLVLEKSDKRDPRPMLGAPFITSRVCAVRIASGCAVARKNQRRYCSLLAAPAMRKSTAWEDVIRNSPFLNGRILYVHDLGDRNKELMAAYPGRSYYRGTYNQSQNKPALEKLRA